MAPSRPRHPDKDIEKFLKKAESRGWTFTRGKKYYMGHCPCGEHLKTVHITPNQRYLGNLRKWMMKLDCWKEQP